MRRCFVDFGLGFLVVWSLLLSSCQTVSPRLSSEELARALPKDTGTMRTISSHNTGLRDAFLSLQASGGWKARGYFSAEESDRIEMLLFRFHVAHHELFQIGERYDGVDLAGARALHAQANALAGEQARFLVDTFGGDPVAIAKLNQAYPRAEIPRHTYDLLADSLESAGARRLVAVGRSLEDDLDDSSYAIQAEVFYRVSRLKSPSARLLKFSAAQKQEIMGFLEPGDLLLTYTAGYASDVFIPGAFKHGLTFVGTVPQRHAVGLKADLLALPGGASEGRKMAADLAQSMTHAGRPANLIEAVAEGVKFSNLDNILETHINRLVVLRPKLTPGERADQLVRVFSYLGEPYDFRFDFADSSRQVCTEVIYRSLNGLNGLDFPLTKRGGHVTLSSDDIINYWLEEKQEGFEFVLYAGGGRGVFRNTARISRGNEGVDRLKRLMAEEG